MSQQTEDQLLRKSNLEDEYQVESRQKLSKLGEVVVMRNSKGHRIIAKERRTQTSEECMQDVAQAVSRLGLNHPNLLGMMDYSVKRDKDGYVILGFYELPETSLAAELEQRKQENAPFHPEELRNLLIDVLEIVVFLRKRKMIHGDIRPEYIMFDGETQIYKMADRLGDPSPPMKVQVRNVQSGRKVYMSPQLFFNIVKEIKGAPKTEQLKLNPYLSEGYSVGMVILEASLLDTCQDVYDFEEGKIDEAKLNKHIDDFASLLQDKDVGLVRAVQDLLEITEEERPDLELLLSGLKSSPQNSDGEDNNQFEEEDEDYIFKEEAEDAIPGIRNVGRLGRIIVEERNEDEEASDDERRQERGSSTPQIGFEEDKIRQELNDFSERVQVELQEKSGAKMNMQIDIHIERHQQNSNRSKQNDYQGIVETAKMQRDGRHYQAVEQVEAVRKQSYQHDSHDQATEASQSKMPKGRGLIHDTRTTEFQEHNQGKFQETQSLLAQQSMSQLQKELNQPAQKINQAYHQNSQQNVYQNVQASGSSNLEKNVAALKQERDDLMDSLQLLKDTNIGNRSGTKQPNIFKDEHEGAMDSAISSTQSTLTKKNSMQNQESVKPLKLSAHQPEMHTQQMPKIDHQNAQHLEGNKLARKDDHHLLRQDGGRLEQRHEMAQNVDRTQKEVHVTSSLTVHTETIRDVHEAAKKSEEVHYQHMQTKYSIDLPVNPLVQPTRLIERDPNMAYIQTQEPLKNTKAVGPSGSVTANLNKELFHTHAGNPQTPIRSENYKGAEFQPSSQMGLSYTPQHHDHQIQFSQTVQSETIETDKKQTNLGGQGNIYQHQPHQAQQSREYSPLPGQRNLGGSSVIREVTPGRTGDPSMSSSSYIHNESTPKVTDNGPRMIEVSPRPAAINRNLANGPSPVARGLDASPQFMLVREREQPVSTNFGQRINDENRAPFVRPIDGFTPDRSEIVKDNYPSLPQDRQSELHKAFDKQTTVTRPALSDKTGMTPTPISYNTYNQQQTPQTSTFMECGSSQLKQQGLFKQAQPMQVMGSAFQQTPSYQGSQLSHQAHYTQAIHDSSAQNAFRQSEASRTVQANQINFKQAQQQFETDRDRNRMSEISRTSQNAQVRNVSPITHVYQNYNTLAGPNYNPIVVREAKLDTQPIVIRSRSTTPIRNAVSGLHAVAEGIAKQFGQVPRQGLSPMVTPQEIQGASAQHYQSGVSNIQPFGCQTGLASFIQGAMVIQETSNARNASISPTPNHIARQNSNTAGSNFDTNRGLGWQDTDRVSQNGHFGNSQRGINNLGSLVRQQNTSAAVNLNSFTSQGGFQSQSNSTPANQPIYAQPGVSFGPTYPNNKLAGLGQPLVHQTQAVTTHHGGGSDNSTQYTTERLQLVKSDNYTNDAKHFQYHTRSKTTLNEYTSTSAGMTHESLRSLNYDSVARDKSPVSGHQPNQGRAVRVAEPIYELSEEQNYGGRGPAYPN